MRNTMVGKMRLMFLDVFILLLILFSSIFLIMITGSGLNFINFRFFVGLLLSSSIMYMTLEKSSLFIYLYFLMFLPLSGLMSDPINSGLLYGYYSGLVYPVIKSIYNNSKANQRLAKPDSTLTYNKQDQNTVIISGINGKASLLYDIMKNMHPEKNLLFYCYYEPVATAKLLDGYSYSLKRRKIKVVRFRQSPYSLYSPSFACDCSDIKVFEEVYLRAFLPDPKPQELPCFFTYWTDDFETIAQGLHEKLYRNPEGVKEALKDYPVIVSNTTRREGGFVDPVFTSTMAFDEIVERIREVYPIQENRELDA